MLNSIVRRPIVLVAVIFLLGIAASRMTGISFVPVYLAAALSLSSGFLSIRKGVICFVLICCSVFFLGASLLKSHVTLPKCHISRYVWEAGKDYCVAKGFVNSPPLFRYNRTSFMLKTRELQIGELRYGCCGDILVYIEGRHDLFYGEETELKGILYSRNQGAPVVLRVKAGYDLMRLNKNKGSAIKKIAFRLKDKIKDVIFSNTSGVTAGLLAAMILGEQGGVAPIIYDSMVKTGTVHILVVSGFNVGIIASIAILLFKLARLPRGARFCMTIPVLIVYCLMTGSSSPVVRATVMAIFFICGWLIKREPDIYNSLGLAAIFILANNPLQLFDTGFQLSFASVLSIIYLYPGIKSFLRIKTPRVSFFGYFIDGCLVSFSAWLGTLGFIAYYFRTFTPAAVLANIFIVPLATLFTLSGLSLIFVGFFSAPIASFFGLNCELLAKVLIYLNCAFAKMPSVVFR